MMPKGAVVFPNDYGTAPALALSREDGKTLILLPGPPRELEPMFREQIEPFLYPFCEAVLFSRNVHIAGMGESMVESLLPRELLDAQNPTVAPYCVAGEVRLRVTARASTRALAADICDKAVDVIRTSPVGPYIYAVDIPSPEAALLAALHTEQCTFACAESCTGGLIAKRMTDLAGSSAVMVGGMVTYQTQTKTDLLGVPAALIEEHGVVSEAVAVRMASECARVFGADLTVATTGFAGPGGGTPSDPVGTVYIAACYREKTYTKRLSISPLRDRAYIRTVAATNAILLALHALREK
jgi:nicotinamide-nucleotide amidase